VDAALATELGRTIDYLATRPEVDAGKLGFYGFSMGSSRFPVLLAVEKRLGAAVLYSGGIDLFGALPLANSRSTISRASRSPC